MIEGGCLMNCPIYRIDNNGNLDNKELVAPIGQIRNGDKEAAVSQINAALCPKQSYLLLARRSEGSITTAKTVERLVFDTTHYLLYT
jgi:hypothetical protein